MQTYQEIEQIVDAEIAAKPELLGLTSSNAAEWKLWKSVYIYAAMSLQFLWEQHKNEQSTLLQDDKMGLSGWYVSKAKEFQFGHELINDDGIFRYEIDDPDARIITQAASVSKEGIVLIKVATEAGVLTSEQRAAFADYWDDVKLFCQPLQIISEHPDKVKGVIIIYFDGKLKLADVKSATDNAINAYLASDLAFGGVFNKIRFERYINESLYVLSKNCDVQVENIQARPSSGTFQDVNYEYISLSGRYLFGFPDDAIPTDQSTITYIRI